MKEKNTLFKGLALVFMALFLSLPMVNSFEIPENPNFEQTTEMVRELYGDFYTAKRYREDPCGSYRLRMLDMYQKYLTKITRYYKYSALAEKYPHASWLAYQRDLQEKYIELYYNAYGRYQNQYFECQNGDDFVRFYNDSPYSTSRCLRTPLGGYVCINLIRATNGRMFIWDYDQPREYLVMGGAFSIYNRDPNTGRLKLNNYWQVGRTHSNCLVARDFLNRTSDYKYCSKINPEDVMKTLAITTVVATTYMVTASTLMEISMVT